MIPEIKTITEVLNHQWELFPSRLDPMPTTPRLFRIQVEDKGFMVRINFDRGKLSATEVVEFVDHLGKSACSVPQIIPTTSGDLSIPVQKVNISIESELPGVECSSERMDILHAVGQELAKIHNASEHFPNMPVQFLPLFDYALPILEKVAKRRLPEDECDTITKLSRRLTEEFSNQLKRPIKWIITHGDIRSPNVLVNGNQVGFTDIFSTFAPALVDLIMIKDKWLMGDPDNRDRSLTMDEVKQFINGYTSIRPFTQEDREAFRIIWAVWASEKFTFFSEDMTRIQDPRRRQKWDFHAKVLDLPNFIDDLEQILN